MDNPLLICITIIIVVGIYCSHKFQKPKVPKIPTPQDQCAHDMQIHTEFENDDEKIVVSVCSKCGYDREYTFSK